MFEIVCEKVYMDTVDKVTRSRIMSKVGQRNTSPELALRKALHRIGFRYKLNDRKLPGSPDIVFPKYRAVIFVHGCFWHRHGCRLTTSPASRQEFWEAKFVANRKRDSENTMKLQQAGWRVAVVWQCALNNKHSVSDIGQRVADWLRSAEFDLEIPSPSSS
jgi:DNA mismatch endonuclease (patch repair protein)